jgi:hypothetical protein
MPKKENEPHVLVGFGKHDLADLLEYTEDEINEQYLIKKLNTQHWPARYRRASICTEEEIENFKRFTEWAVQKVRSK